MAVENSDVMAGTRGLNRLDRNLFLDAFVRLGMMRINCVADIGCGTGPFVEVMVERRQRPEVYWGVDQDMDKIETARGLYPDWSFAYGDFFTGRVKNELVKFDAYLLVRVLEHVEDDLGLLAGLESGRPVVLAVAGFEAPGQVRWFQDQHSVRERYFSLLDVKTVGQYRRPTGEIWYTASGVRW
ncbi:MAG: class I SAM-dependent methyltransferase [Thermodesulfobacteriota bacterium]